jgi:hypothetical protein
MLLSHKMVAPMTGATETRAPERRTLQHENLREKASSGEFREEYATAKDGNPTIRRLSGSFPIESASGPCALTLPLLAHFQRALRDHC